MIIELTTPLNLSTCRLAQTFNSALPWAVILVTLNQSFRLLFNLLTNSLFLSVQGQRACNCSDDFNLILFFYQLTRYLVNLLAASPLIHRVLLHQSGKLNAKKST